MNSKEIHEEPSFNQLINKLVDSSKLKFKNNTKALDPVNYLDRLYKQCDSTKFENVLLTKLILKCQLSLDDDEDTLENFAQQLLELIEYLNKCKTTSVKRIKLNKIAIEPAPSESAIASNSSEIKKNSSFVNDNNDKEENEHKGAHHIALEDEEDESPLNKEEMKALSHIKKLDEFCMKLSKKITDYEKAEISLDDLDSNQSKYLQEEILKKRFKTAYDRLVSKMRQYPQLVDVKKMPKLCKKSDKSFRKLTEFNATRYPEIDKKVQDKLNKLREFPDFLEVVEWVTEANKESQLALHQEMLEKLAKDAFEEIGRYLKKSRYADLIQIQSSRIWSVEPEIFENESDDNVFKKSDPALNDPEIEKVLKENKRIAEENLNEIYEEFTRKQVNGEDFSENGEEELSENEDDEEAAEKEEEEELEENNTLDNTPETSASTEELNENNHSEKSTSPLNSSASSSAQEKEEEETTPPAPAPPVTAPSVSPSPKSNKATAVALLVQSVLKTKPTESKKRESTELDENKSQTKKIKSELEDKKKRPSEAKPTTSGNATDATTSTTPSPNAQKKKLRKSTKKISISASQTNLDDSLPCIVID